MDDYVNILDKNKQNNSSIHQDLNLIRNPNIEPKDSASIHSFDSLNDRININMKRNQSNTSLDN